MSNHETFYAGLMERGAIEIEAEGYTRVPIRAAGYPHIREILPPSISSDDFFPGMVPPALSTTGVGVFDKPSGGRLRRVFPFPTGERRVGVGDRLEVSLPAFS